MKERNVYNASMKYKWDSQNVLDYAVEEATRKAERVSFLKVAKNLKSKGMSKEEIQDVTGLSKEDIEEL